MTIDEPVYVGALPTAIDVDASIVTSVELEHTDLLGDTVTAIAGEKAHVIRPGSHARNVSAVLRDSEFPEILDIRASGSSQCDAGAQHKKTYGEHCRSFHDSLLYVTMAV